jgi:hypothetical protein
MSSGNLVGVKASFLPPQTSCLTRKDLIVLRCRCCEEERIFFYPINIMDGGSAPIFY